MKTPAAEITIDEQLIRSLLEEQFPELANMPLAYLNEGWDNVMYRLGETLLIRLPRRQMAVPFIEREQRWLLQLAPHLPLPVSAPKHLGGPQGNYPWPWSIVSWQAGKMAATQTIQSAEAIKLVEFLKALHSIAVPSDAPLNPHRTSPLATKAEGTMQRLERFTEQGLITRKMIDYWQRAEQITCPTEQRCLIHGDLHPKNILANEGVLTAIIDWGDFTLGDPATDLAIIWMLFSDASVRSSALSRYKADELLVGRAIGWAIFFGAILLDIGLEGDEIFHKVGQKTLANLQETDWPRG